MSLKIGSNNIGDVYVGGSKISSIFVGNNQVYSSQILDPDAPRDFIINVTKQTLDTYISSNESYKNDKYVAVKIATGTTTSGVTRTATITYGGITKTVTNTRTSEPETVRFGLYKGVDDGTPDTGDMIISGDYIYVSFDFTVQTAKLAYTQINCVNNIVQYFGNQLTSSCYMGSQTGLTSFVTPTFVTSATIDLSNCSNIESIKMSPIQTQTPRIKGCTKVTSIEIPSTVTKVLSSGFQGCTGLTSITLPSACTTIESQAFSGCTGLTSIVIPSSVTSIKSKAFQSCTNIASVTLPDSVTDIGESVFGGCSSLTTIHIPTGITAIPKSMFMGCSSLNLSIPNHITTIGESAFSACTSLTTRLPNSITTIEASAFSGCTSLTTTLPNSITTIGASAFQGCTSLPAQLNIPNVTTLGASAFSYCSKITSVVHNSLVSIGATAFSRCKIASWVVEETTTTIGNGFLSYNPITTLSVSANNTTFDSRNNSNAIINTASNTIIQGCVNTSIKSSVTAIAARAFEGMQGDFTGFVIPANITSIDNSAFNDIATIKRLYFAHTSISTLSLPEMGNVFANQDPWVQYYFKDTEENVTNWGRFKVLNFTNTTYHSY